MVIFQNLSKNGEMLKNVGENSKKWFFFSLIFFYTQDIKNISFNPKFYQHFLPSLIINIRDVTFKLCRESVSIALYKYFENPCLTSKPYYHRALI